MIEKVSKLLKFAALLMPLDPAPVIKTLQRQMNVFVGFELDHRQLAGAGNGKHIDHGAVCGCERRHLHIHIIVIETRIKQCDLPANHRF